MKSTLVLLVVSLSAIPLSAQSEIRAPIGDYDEIHHPVEGSGGMVAAQEAVAAQVGRDLLAQGGNAVDAAVGIGFALAVTLPRAGNIGGGGFMLIHLAEGNRNIAIDYREMAPQAATRAMFINDKDSVDEQASRYSHRVSGVPGTVRGLLLALEKYGKLPRAKVMAPAIKLAEQGVTVTPGLSQSLQGRKHAFRNSPEAMRIFFKKDTANYLPGEILKQKDLAWSLKTISKQGAKAFYQGEIAARIADDMKKNGGLVTLADLQGYQAVERPVLEGRFRKYTVLTMPPPSSGGVHVLQLLNILEGFPLREMGLNSAAYIHALAEAMKHVYADRSAYLGDPDFVKVPIAELLTPAYAARLRSEINSDKTRPSSEIRPHDLSPYESHETTHFSVADKDGNAVSNTYTLNFSYGSHKVVAGTGILLNNEMDDFSAKPGVPNAFGLLGGDANAIAPGKRPLSSMAPTMVLQDGKVLLVTGSPGGSQIITVVLQVLLNTLEHGMNIQDATDAPRIHHQWFPDILNLEPGISKDTQALLIRRGHVLKASSTMGSAQSILVRDGRFYGASDPRRPDALSLAVGP